MTNWKYLLVTLCLKILLSWVTTWQYYVRITRNNSVALGERLHTDTLVLRILSITTMKTGYERSPSFAYHLGGTHVRSGRTSTSEQHQNALGCTKKQGPLTEETLKSLTAEFVLVVRG